MPIRISGFAYWLWCRRHSTPDKDNRARCNGALTERLQGGLANGSMKPSARDPWPVPGFAWRHIGYIAALTAENSARSPEEFSWLCALTGFDKPRRATSPCSRGLDRAHSGPTSPRKEALGPDCSAPGLLSTRVSVVESRPQAQYKLGADLKDLNDSQAWSASTGTSVRGVISYPQEPQSWSLVESIRWKFPPRTARLPSPRGRPLLTRWSAEGSLASSAI